MALPAITNLAPQVYHDLLDQLADAHAKVRRHNPQSRVEIVYAGNIFELRRTHFWFEQGDHKPWRHFGLATGVAQSRPPQSAEYMQRAVGLFTRIMTHPHVAPIKGILGDKLADRIGGVEPVRGYVPGDADRLINMSPDLRMRVIDFLGLDLGRSPGWNPEQRFPNAWYDAYHGTFIRHGHEWDVYSFEGDPGKPEDYDNIPMSDLITTELFARLTYEASVMQGSPEAPAELVAEFSRKLQHIDNVRPVSSLVRWLAFHFANPVEQKLLGACIERALNNFKGPGVRQVVAVLGRPRQDVDARRRGRSHRVAARGPQAPVDGQGQARALGLRQVRQLRSLRALRRARPEGAGAASGRLSDLSCRVRAHARGQARAARLRRRWALAPDGALHQHRQRSADAHGHADGRDFFVSESLDFAIFYRADEKPGATRPSFELRTVTRSRQ